MIKIAEIEGIFFRIKSKEYVDGVTENISKITCRAQDKNKIKKYEQKAIYSSADSSLVWVSIYCESKMERHGKMITELQLYNKLNPEVTNEKETKV